VSKEGRTAVLIVTHGPAGADMLAEATRLIGSAAAAGMESLVVAPGDEREAIDERLRAAVARLDEGRGVLVLVDLAGSTPCNCAVRIKRDGRAVEVLCGLSLPMLVKVATADRLMLRPIELAHEAAATAMKSIKLGDGGTP
jgi:mannose/fructose-specific phosphotransferase system component IIA